MKYSACTLKFLGITFGKVFRKGRGNRLNMDQLFHDQGPCNRVGRIKGRGFSLGICGGNMLLAKECPQNSRFERQSLES